MAYPQYGQMESAGDMGLLPTPGDASYQPTDAAAYPPPGHNQGILKLLVLQASLMKVM